MVLRSRSFLVVVVLAMLVAVLPSVSVAQDEDIVPTWVDSMDSAETGLLTQESPDESLFTYVYDQGQYAMQAHDTGYFGDLYSYLSIGQPVDTRTAVDFSIENDQPGKYVFVGCRAGEIDNGYAFEVHPVSGDVKLWVLGETDAHILAEGNAADLIVPGFVFNTIEIECWQNLISGAINGEVVLADFDDTFTAGYSYIGTGVLESNPSDISVVFDNLSVIDFAVSDSTPTGTETGGATQIQPGLEGAIAFSQQDQPLAGPISASADVFDGDFKSLAAEVNVGPFYAQFDFVAPTSVPAGFWTAGFCFWIDQNGSCLEAVIGDNGSTTQWILGDAGPDGAYELLESGEVVGLDLTPGAVNTVGLYVDGQTGILTFNSNAPGATFTLPRSGTGDVAVQLSFTAAADNEPGSFLMDTSGFSVWDLGAQAAPTAAAEVTPQIQPTVATQPTVGTQPTVAIQPTVATQPTTATSGGASNFDQIKTATQSQAATVGLISATLIQSTATLPWAPAGVSLADVYISATFINPIDVSAPWDIGLAIRYTGDNTDARIIVDSTGLWSLTVGGGQAVTTGQLTNFATGPGALNTLEVTAVGAAGTFALNGLVIAELDLTGSPNTGDVFASSGFFPANVVEGRMVVVQDFSVWNASGQTPPAEPTQVTVQPTTAATNDIDAAFRQQKSGAMLNPPLSAPLQGALVQQAGFLYQVNADVNVADLYVSATFLNPAEISTPWDMGINIRGSGSGDEFRFFVDSSGAWYVALGLAAPIATGTLTNLNTSAGGANTIEISAQGSTGFAVVNEVVVAPLDLSTFPQSGDIFLATGYFNENIVADRQIPFFSFQVWPVSAGEQPAAPTVETAGAVDPAAAFNDLKTSALTQSPAAGPLSGVLTQSSTTFPSALAGVNLADFYATVTFLNPTDISAGWNIGLGLRYSDANLEMRFIVDSAGNWFFATGGAQATPGGQVTNFETVSGGSNTIEAVAVGNLAYVVLNGQLVTTFDLSANAVSGDIFIGAGFLNSGIVEGRQIQYQNLSVWPIPPGA